MRWSEECWTFPDVLLVLALLPALCLGGSEYAPALSSGYHPYSSCHLDTGWTKGDIKDCVVFAAVLAVIQKLTEWSSIILRLLHMLLLLIATF